MGIFFKWLGIFLGVSLLISFVAVGVVGIVAEGTGASEISGNVIKWVVIIVGSICLFFMVLQECAEAEGPGMVIGELFITGLGITGIVVANTNKALGLVLLGFIVLVMSADMFSSLSEDEYDEKHELYLSIDGSPFEKIAGWITHVEFGWLGIVFHILIYFVPVCLLSNNPDYSTYMWVAIAVLVVRQIRRFIVMAVA